MTDECCRGLAAPLQAGKCCIVASHLKIFIFYLNSKELLWEMFQSPLVQGLFQSKNGASVAAELLIKSNFSVL